MNSDWTHLHWKPVLLMKVIHPPFGETHTGLSVKRLYLAEHPDGILRADWTLPADERLIPLVQWTGWNLQRDVPFDLPVQYKRGGVGVPSLIPSGTWVLSYDEDHYRLYERVQTAIRSLLIQVDTAPTDPQTLRMLTRWIL
jgi:hypothetical protein